MSTAFHDKGERSIIGFYSISKGPDGMENSVNGQKVSSRKRDCSWSVLSCLSWNKVKQNVSAFHCTSGRRKHVSARPISGPAVYLAPWAVPVGPDSAGCHSSSSQGSVAGAATPGEAQDTLQWMDLTLWAALGSDLATSGHPVAQRNGCGCQSSPAQEALA